MIHKFARYKVKPEKLAEAQESVREFVATVNAQEPGTIYYAYQERNSFHFYHIMAFADAEAEKTHRNSTHLKKLMAGLYPICEEPPRFGDLKLLAGGEKSDN
ncbi:MAG: antibiotic biosynthesis monooxygenase [bacterium]